MRIRVSDVLGLLGAGLTAEQILDEMPDLEVDDLKASLVYAARQLGRMDPGVGLVTWQCTGAAS